SGSAAQERGVGPRGAFDEDLLDATDPPPVPFECRPLDDLDETLDAIVLDVVRHLTWHCSCFRPGARRVDEGERAIEADLLDNFPNSVRRSGSRSRPQEFTFCPSSVISLTPSRARPSTSARTSPGRRETSRPRTEGTMQ